MGGADARRRALVLLAGCLLVALVVSVVLVVRRAPEGSDACGPVLAKGDDGVWECAFHDDFSGSRLDRDRWRVLGSPPSGEPAGPRACPVDRPETVSVADGQLHLSVIPSPTPVTCHGRPASYLSGQVGTQDLFEQRYGRFEARVRVEPADVPGLQEAFWLWPAEPPRPGEPVWPAAGEIDVAETYSAYPAHVVPFLHYTADDNGGPVPGTTTAHCAGARGDWHTYTLEWGPTELRILVDGEECLRNTDDDPAFDKPFFLVLSAMLGRGVNAYDGRAPLPATMHVDYVRAWR
jgi:beta-glucanase (GH16 family)